MTFPANRSSANRPFLTLVKIRLVGAYHVITKTAIAASYSINLVRLSLVSKYKIRTSARFTAPWHIITGTSIAGKYKIGLGNKLTGNYNINLNSKLNSRYHIHMKKSIESKYGIIFPTVRLESPYNITHQSDEIYFGPQKLIGAEATESGGFDIATTMRDLNSGTRIVIPPQFIGYRNTFEGVTLKISDIRRFQNELARGWFKLAVFGEEYQDCVLVGFEYRREPHIDYYYYNASVAQDTRFKNNDPIIYGGNGVSITIRNWAFASDIDANIAESSTRFTNHNVLLNTSTIPQWTVSFQCLIENRQIINSLVVMLNQNNILTFGGKSYQNMKITRLSEGKTYTNVYRNGVLQTITELNITFGQNTSGV